MRKDSVTEQFYVYFTAGILGAHFNYRQKGFRQKDVRFLIEVFSNWMESTIGDVAVPLHNVQISRFLHQLSTEGCIKRIKGLVPRYQLTPKGLLRLTSALVTRPQFLPLERIFFIYYFLKTYGKMFYELLEDEASQFSPALRAELVALRKPEILLENQLRFLDKEIAKFDARIKEAFDAANLGDSVVEKKGGLEEVVAAIQKHFPYELNSRKPLKELINEIPESQRLWELTHGLRNRGEHLWKPLREFFKYNREILRDMVEQ